MRCLPPLNPTLFFPMTPLSQRFHAIGAPGAVDVLPIQLGSRADYLALKPHHYRPGNPATMMRVLVVRGDTPSAGDRFVSRSVVSRPVAVLVESLPSLSCRLRDEALGGRYGHLRPRPRSALLMQELRCISRVIVDPRYRGLSLAVRLVRHALETATTRYTEALAVMGRVSPFFERAGMTAYERPPLASAQRALDALGYVGIRPNELALPARVEMHINALPSDQSRWIHHELLRWYRTAAGRGAKKSPSLLEVLAAAQQGLLACPIYYLKENTHARIDRPTDTCPAAGPA